MNELTEIKDRILARIENYIADIELVGELTDDEKTIFASVKNIINEEFGKREVKLNTENEPHLSKQAFVVIDQLIKEHKDLYGCITFKTFTGGKHQRITTNQLIKELDKLYNYYYGKGETSGKGIK